LVSGVGHGSFLKFDVICDVVEPDSGVLDLVGFVEKVEDVSANTEAVGVAQQSADDKQTSVSSSAAGRSEKCFSSFLRMAWTSSAVVERVSVFVMRKLSA
jgi:hypothetical protein